MTHGATYRAGSKWGLMFWILLIFLAILCERRTNYLFKSIYTVLWIQEEPATPASHDQTHVCNDPKGNQLRALPITRRHLNSSNNTKAIPLPGPTMVALLTFSR